MANQRAIPPPYAGPAQAYAPGQPQQPITTQPVVSTTAAVAGNQSSQMQLRDWHHGICSCYKDCGYSVLGLFCPWMPLCDVTGQLHENCCWACLCPGSLVALRVKLRLQHNIKGDLCDDCCCVLCCPMCVLWQMAHEVQHIRDTWYQGGRIPRIN